MEMEAMFKVSNLKIDFKLSSYLRNPTMIKFSE